MIWGMRCKRAIGRPFTNTEYDKLLENAMTKSKDKWIQGAIKKPGALHKQLKVPMDKKIPAKKLEKAAEKGGKLGQRARLAETLKGMKKK